MTVIRSALFALIFYGWTVFAVLLSFPISLFGDRPLRAWAHGWAYFHRWCAAWLLGIRSKVEGELPDGPPTLSSEVLERLLAYPWPGNVREMRNVLERALILARGTAQVGVEHLPAELRARAGAGDRRHTPLSLDDLERQHIERTLRHHSGNRTRAALELGISRATLINKIKRYQLGA